MFDSLLFVQTSGLPVNRTIYVTNQGHKMTGTLDNEGLPNPKNIKESG